MNMSFTSTYRSIMHCSEHAYPLGSYLASQMHFAHCYTTQRLGLWRGRGRSTASTGIREAAILALFMVQGLNWFAGLALAEREAKADLRDIVADLTHLGKSFGSNSGEVRPSRPFGNKSPSMPNALRPLAGVGLAGPMVSPVKRPGVRCVICYSRKSNNSRTLNT